MRQIITPVVFRRWKDTATIIALFPDSPADINGWYCDSYERIGQHGGADYHGVIAHTVPASQKESAPLTCELVRIGYRLKVLQRASRHHHEHRRQTALQFSSA